MPSSATRQGIRSGLGTRIIWSTGRSGPRSGNGSPSSPWRRGGLPWTTISRADPELPTNAEKAATPEAPRGEYRLCEILPVVGMAKSSYEYVRNAQAKGETEERAAARKAVVEAFEASGGTCGHRRIAAVAGAGERAVRGIMRNEGLVARAAKKKRRYSPYEGEVSEAPPSLPRDEEDRHRFGADELWITDVAGFRVPAGKVCLSPIADCFDGMPLSWSISASPDAEMANSSLTDACGWLNEGDRPTVRSNRGGAVAVRDG